MSAHKPRPRAVNLEAYHMIEAALYELVPPPEEALAKRLSRQLSTFKSLQSLDQSSGMECLKLRLKKLSKELLQIAEQRKRCSHASQSSELNKNEVSSKAMSSKDAKVSSRHAKHNILIQTVGEDKYNDILSAYREIKQIRRCSAVWTKFTKQHTPNSFSKKVGEIGDSDEEEEAWSSGEEDHKPVSETLPAPISDIYFRMTRFVNVVQSLKARSFSCSSCCRPQQGEVPQPCECTFCECILHETDWDVLLRDARSKLSAFRQFERKHFKTDEDLPSFKCGSGMCSFRLSHGTP